VRLTEKLLSKFQDEPDKTARRKMARQAARSVLPNATETKIFVTANARALRHFIELRGSRHAETEIRKLAVAVLEIMKREAPHLFDDYELSPLPDGTFEATTRFHKV
jgi:thymidylate synthase (FAD)